MGDQTLPAPTVSWSASQVPQAWASVQVPVVDPSSYQIKREVARGGVGRILEAVDTRLQREVALKQLLHRGSDEARFIREAVLTARLQHPSIVPIHAPWRSCLSHRDGWSSCSRRCSRCSSPPPS